MSVNRNLFATEKRQVVNNGTNAMPNLWTMRSTQDHTGKDDDDYKARRFKKNAEHHATTEDKCVLCFKKYKITITEKIKTPNSKTRIKYTCTHIYGVGIYIPVSIAVDVFVEDY